MKQPKTCQVPFCKTHPTERLAGTHETFWFCGRHAVQYTVLGYRPVPVR